MLSPLNNQKTNGATLLEILVVVAIVIIMSGLGLANYRGVQAENELRDATELVKNTVLETQALALGPRNVSKLGIDKYFVQIETGQIKIFEGYTNASSTEIRKHVLPDTISTTIPANQFANAPPVITFNVLEQGKVTAGLVGSTACLEIRSSRTTNIKNLTVIKATALININNGNCS